MVLYSQLRQQTVQTLRGASKVTPYAEWQFVLHSAKIYDRMGCDFLGLDLGKLPATFTIRLLRPWRRTPLTKHLVQSGIGSSCAQTWAIRERLDHCSYQRDEPLPWFRTSQRGLGRPGNRRLTSRMASANQRSSTSRMQTHSLTVSDSRLSLWRGGGAAPCRIAFT